RLLAVFFSQQLAQNRGNHLPRQAEFVLEPPALDFLAAGGELLPEMVHFLLALAVDDEGYRLGELEHRPAVQRDEILARALESHRHDRSLRSAGGLGPPFVVASGAPDLRVLGARRVEWSGSLRLWSTA